MPIDRVLNALTVARRRLPVEKRDRRVERVLTRVEQHGISASSRRHRSRVSLRGIGAGGVDREHFGGPRFVRQKVVERRRARPATHRAPTLASSRRQRWRTGSPPRRARATISATSTPGIFALRPAGTLGSSVSST